MIADVVIGLQHGDEAKGKVTHVKCKEGKDFYTHVLRFNGGGNAGHTIYHEGKKFVTHYIPAGIFYGIKSVIGNGCAVNVKSFLEEAKMLADAGFDTSLIKIASNCHIVTEEHLEEDGKDDKIGTTKRGNGPAYTAKYARTGVRACDVPEFEEHIIDLYEEFHSGNDVNILCEGAQGFELDIDWGDYPYVTSSHCTTAGVSLNCVPPSWIRNVWGVGKVYDTYVGKKDFEPDDLIFQEIRDAGEEYGATTGRPRQCNWLDLDALIRAININGVTQVVLNKADVLKEVGAWKLYHQGELLDFPDYRKMEKFIHNTLCEESALKEQLKYSFRQGEGHNHQKPKKTGQFRWHKDMVLFSSSKDKI